MTAPIIHFWRKKHFTKVASRQTDIPFYRGIGRQRGRGFVAVAQVIRKTAIPFLRNYIFPTAKRVGADFLEFITPGKVEVVSGGKKFRKAAKNVGEQSLIKQLGSRSPNQKVVRNVRQANRVGPEKSETKQTIRSQREIFTKSSRWSCHAFFGNNPFATFW